MPQPATAIDPVEARRRIAAKLRLENRAAALVAATVGGRGNAWPNMYISDGGTPRPFHLGQRLAWESTRRTVAMIAGSQGGKTGYGPWWLHKEIQERGGGDYLAVTASYDLFKLKMLPAMLEVFEGILQIGRFWSGDRIIELKNPKTGQFDAEKSNDPMYSRIILRSAESLGGLESATARAAWLDEAGQDSFTILAWRAINRRLALNHGRRLITTTLYNLGWLITEIIDKAENGGEVQIERIGEAELEYTDNEAADIALIQFDSIINPAYPMDEYEEARRTLPNDDFQLFYRGRKAKLRTLIYDCFDRKLHTCARFPIPPNWKRYLGLDFGGVHTAAVFYAEEPTTEHLYGYREYLAGGRTARQHVDALLEGEPGRPFCVGGSSSEGQWRDEFAAAGLPIHEPDITDVGLGIQRVYGVKKDRGITYFDDLTGIIDQNGRYRHKRDRYGNITDEIEQKATFHYLDGERYIISYIRKGAGKPALPKEERQTSKWGQFDNAEPAAGNGDGSKWRKF